MDKIRVTPDMTEEQMLKQIGKLRIVAREELAKIDAEIKSLQDEIDAYDRMLERAKNASIIWICISVSLLILTIVFVLLN